MLIGSFNVISAGILLIALAACGGLQWSGAPPAVQGVVLAVGLVVAAAPRVIQEWERGVLLRLGRFQRVLNPGVVWVIPAVDNIVSLVDMRIRATPFSAEKTLTKDTVPVDVDAVLFWVVTDAKQAVLEVERYEPTVSWAAQTTLRDVIGRTVLARMISDREGLDAELQRIIDTKTTEWGITVQSVEIRDVRIPAGLEDAMSRKAQADREKAARITLAESESLVAEEMTKAARIYEQNDSAMRLRAMNMTYESIKERGALMVIPSGMADAMDPGVIGLAAASFPSVRDAAQGDET